MFIYCVIDCIVFQVVQLGDHKNEKKHLIGKSRFEISFLFSQACKVWETMFRKWIFFFTMSALYQCFLKQKFKGKNWRGWDKFGTHYVGLSHWPLHMDDGQCRKIEAKRSPYQSKSRRYCSTVNESAMGHLRRCILIKETFEEEQI